jgi:hypothetical protein
MNAFLHSVHPLFLPKRNKRFGLSLALAGQKVYIKSSEIVPEAINISSQKHEDVGKIYDDRMKNNYFKFFEMLITYLTKIDPDIVEINDFIHYVEKEKGENTLESIDLLSFLLSLSYLPDNLNENIYGEENIQMIRLDEKQLIVDKPIEIFQVQELLTYFWFERLKMEYNADIQIITDPQNKVFIKAQNDRSIGNIKIKLIERGSRKDV